MHRSVAWLFFSIEIPLCVRDDTEGTKRKTPELTGALLC